ncbi:MAG TPA: hypothetical protein VGK34_05515 [Armatimonadota bacterium]|jgi:hypothetical protein
MIQGKALEIVGAANGDMARHDLRRAKDRLRAVLMTSPLFPPALDAMGRIYYEHRDFRNAVMYWSRSNRWDDQARHACEQVISATMRALRHENIRSVRYQLYAFAGCTPPSDIARRLALLQSAYFKLDEKRSRYAGLSCVPVAGLIMLTALALLSIILGGGWSSLAWIGGFSFVATGIVFGLNVSLYLHASKIFCRAMRSMSQEMKKL